MHPDEGNSLQRYARQHPWGVAVLGGLAVAVFAGLAVGSSTSSVLVGVVSGAVIGAVAFVISGLLGWYEVQDSGLTSQVRALRRWAVSHPWIVGIVTGLVLFLLVAGGNLAGGASPGPSLIQGGVAGVVAGLAMAILAARRSSQNM